MKSPRILAPTALLLTLSALHPGPVLGQTDDALRTVRYTEADLTQRDRAAALYGRIRFAADRACQALDGASLSRKHEFSTCRTAALDGAVRAIGSPLVTALHEGGRGSDVVWASR